MREVGKSMRKIREREELTIAGLAELAWVSENSIFKYETGQIFPGLYNLVRLADVLGVSLDEYIGRGQAMDE